MARYCATNLHFLLFVSLTYVPRYSQCHCTKFCVSLIVAHNSHITVVYLYPIFCTIRLQTGPTADRNQDDIHMIALLA